MRSLFKAVNTFVSIFLLFSVSFVVWALFCLFIITLFSGKEFWRKSVKKNQFLSTGDHPFHRGLCSEFCSFSADGAQQCPLGKWLGLISSCSKRVKCWEHSFHGYIPIIPLQGFKGCLGRAVCFFWDRALVCSPGWPSTYDGSPGFMPLVRGHGGVKG